MKKIFLPKGSYGYIENRKLITTLRTLLYFVLCIGLYVIGYVTTGSNKNLLTIVAILGTLPACKSAVNMIIFLRAKGCSAGLKEQVSPYDEALIAFYDLYFTTYQTNFAISHMVLKGSVLCGITENPKCDVNSAQEHLEHMLLQEGIKNMTVKIFSDAGKYVDRLGQLAKLEVEERKKQDDVINLLYSISL
jgi:hypothetical protein